MNESDPSKPSKLPSQVGKAWNAAQMSSIGIELVVATVLGWAAGQWLDGYFGTDPWLMLLFLLVGVAAGFKGLIRAAKKASLQLQDPPVSP